jgi:hypothetical protein
MRKETTKVLARRARAEVEAIDRLDLRSASKEWDARSAPSPRLS